MLWIAFQQTPDLKKEDSRDDETTRNSHLTKLTARALVSISPRARAAADTAASWPSVTDTLRTDG